MAYCRCTQATAGLVQGRYHRLTDPVKVPSGAGTVLSEDSTPAPSA